MNPLKRAQGRPRNQRTVNLRELSPRQINTQLFIQDQKEFDRAKNQNECSEAEMIRRIVHQWSKRQRLGKEDADDLETRIRKAHEAAVAEQVGLIKEEIRNLLAALGSITEMIAAGDVSRRLGRDTEPDSSLAEIEAQSSLKDTLERLQNELYNTRREMSEAIGQILSLAAQQGEKMTLQEAFLERLTAMSKANYLLTGQTFAAGWAALDFVQRFVVEPVLKTMRSDSYEAAVMHRDDARKEGLELVVTMCKEFRFPGTLMMRLYSPSEDEP